MKKLFYYVALCLVTTTVFSSCSDDDDNKSHAEAELKKQEEMKDLTTTYVNDVVYYTYGKLADATESLYGKIETMKSNLSAGNLTQDQIDDVCNTFLEARAWWEKARHGSMVRLMSMASIRTSTHGH